MRVRALAVVVTLVAGCSTPPAAVDRHGRLLTLAAGEAGQIADAGDRLKRQLNFADRQLDDGHAAEGRRILADAAGTLRSADKPTDLPVRMRIAGWVSISELSRRADDPAAAGVACDAAVAVLRSMDPVAERPEFAVGVSNELRELRGKPAAAAVLKESAEWAKVIPDKDWRRQALAALADATFDCDDFDAGLAELRVEPDPVWRSDTLASLAGPRQLDWVSSVGNGAVPFSPADKQTYDGRESAPTQSFSAGLARPASRPFGQSVDYQSVFGSRSR